MCGWCTIFGRTENDKLPRQARDKLKPDQTKPNQDETKQTKTKRKAKTALFFDRIGRPEGEGPDGESAFPEVRKPPFLSHVVLSDRFTKTGSGQTWDGLRGKSRFVQGALVQYGHAAAREAARRHQPSLRSLRCGQLHCTTGATKPSLSVSSLFVSFRFVSNLLSNTAVCQDRLGTDRRTGHST